jgi:hypothetical protein
MTDDRDMPLVGLRLLTLWSGFYVLAGISLIVVRYLWCWSHERSTASCSPDAVLSIRGLFWLGLQLPSVLWALFHRFFAVVMFSVLVEATVDAFRSVPDYVVSVYALHVVTTCCCFAIPREATWWGMISAECAVAVTLTEFLVATRQRSRMNRLIRRVEATGDDDDTGQVA